MIFIPLVSMAIGLLASHGAEAMALQPRAATSTFDLYAYGENITAGLRLFYGDGLAYVGSSAPASVKEELNITFSMPADATISNFLATSNSTTTQWNSSQMLYIDDSANAFLPLRFTTSNISFSGGNTTEGFGLYEGYAFHLSSDGAVEMQFYASPTEEEDVYLVKWKGDSATATDGVPIALRTAAPAH